MTLTIAVHVQIDDEKPSKNTIYRDIHNQRIESDTNLLLQQACFVQIISYHLFSFTELATE